MNPRRRRFGWILGGGDPWSSWTLAATANHSGLRQQLRWPVRRVHPSKRMVQGSGANSGESDNPSSDSYNISSSCQCCDLYPLFPYWSVSFLFGRGESNICEFISWVDDQWPPEFQQVACGIWHLYRLEAIQLRNDAIEEKEAMLSE